jgi:hypothetical protein
MSKGATVSDRLFVGIFPGGISYCDKERERDGDYVRIAFLPYTSLELKIEDDCPAELMPLVLADAHSIQSRRGEFFRTSSCDQGVTLGR